MGNNIMKKIAYLLILSSFFIFASASIMSIKESKLSTTKNLTANDEVSITTKPDAELSDNTGKNSVKDNNYGDNAIVNTNPNTDNSKNKITPSPSYVDTNDQLRNSLEQIYNVNIVYGSETNGYVVGGMNTVSLSNSEDITKALNNLGVCLSRYPKNLFNEIHSSYPLNIYLIDKYSVQNVTGVTDSTNRTVNISIATAYPFEVSFHHEVYHYIEHYIFSKGAYYTTWNSLNPGGFNYGSVNNNLAYSKTLSADAYFVNEYAMYSDAEDRASTFEYMTSNSKASCLNKDKHIYLKAKYMAQTMEYYLDSVSPSVTEYWERFL